MHVNYLNKVTVYTYSLLTIRTRGMSYVYVTFMLIVFIVRRLRRKLNLN